MKEKILFVALFTLSATVAQASPCSSSGITHNPDGSVTFQNPVLLRGDQTLPIENFMVPGACALFGFDSFLEGSLKQSDSNELGAYLNADGSFNSTVNQRPATEITCFQSGQIHNVGEAGNVIYISGRRQDQDSFKQDGIILKNLN